MPNIEQQYRVDLFDIFARRTVAKVSQAPEICPDADLRSTGQRFYASGYGRFNTADPYAASGGPNDPTSWNRYSYVQGDPINHVDRRGLCTEDIDGNFWDDWTEPWVSEVQEYTPGSCYGDAAFQTLYTTIGARLNGVFVLAAAATSVSESIPDCNTVLASDISTYLSSYDSGKTPLNTAGNIQTLVAVGYADDVDPRLVVALAVAETSGGQNMNWGTYNAWNNGHQSYGSWADAIAGVTKNLANNYLGAGIMDTTALYKKYEATTGKVHERQLGVLDGALKSMRGSPTALTDPCNPLNLRSPNQ
jgi:RHS repeat-associated protein